MGNVQIRRNSVRIRVSDGFDPKTNTRLQRYAASGTSV